MQARIAWRTILSLAAIKFLLHLYTSGSYHYFRDELYYIACGRHLDWGYVDHPPLVALYARFGELLGPSLRGFRLLATIAGALRIVLTGVLTARIGGTRVAQAVACIAVFFAPVNLAIDSILSMNVMEHVLWLACLLVLVEIANGADERWWLAFGALAGLGLQNKHSMLFLGFAIAVAVILTPLRRSLARPWIYAGGALALLIFLPNLLWEVRHDWATLELLHNVKVTGKNVVLPPGAFMRQQAMMLNPFSAPLWIAGLFALFFSRELAPYRFLAWTYVVLVITFIALEAKDYYVAPIYPVLFAGGATWFFSASAARARRITGYAILTLITLGGLVAAPLALPLLPPSRFLAYQRALGVKPQRAEVSHTSEMPQIFSDQFGWEELVQRVARYYHSLPPDMRRKTAIYTGNYGEAGAIDFYGPKYGLPPAISGHQNYFLWGTRGFTGASVILIEYGPHPEMWQSLRMVDRAGAPYAMPDERVPIFHGVGLKQPLSEVWPSVKHWR
ncbi:MAG TPA: glycosyltransferase family 39 protein [Thermoanaerobaculia bacterium]|nr:glycosyltransferase family 39 protein [Thermoanaerobaculia bacterium]